MTSVADGGDRPKAFTTAELILAGLVSTINPDSPAAVFAYLCRQELYERTPGVVGDDLPHEKR
jgi:hypothetical protein